MQGAYPPLNTLKPVGEGLWLIDGPAVMHRRLPLPSRAAVAQLADGTLWIHAPTQITRALQDELEALGPLAHIFAPNPPHDAHLDAWRHFYPQASVWTAHNLEEASPWADEIDHLILAGAPAHKEVVFHHRRSETLVIADLLANFETERLPAWVRPFIWLSGTDYPDGGMSPRMRRTFRDRDALAESIMQMIDWRPRRLLLVHGRWYERDAVAELERAFRKILSERLWMKAVDDIKARER
jgi:hypothetical protein